MVVQAPLCHLAFHQLSLMAQCGQSDCIAAVAIDFICLVSWLRS